MDTKELFLRISQNDENFGQCSADTAANVLNNEEILDKPATYFMYEPKQDDIDINGSIKIKGTRMMLESGSYEGTGATLANARLYAFFKPIQNELFEKENEYKKFVFDNSDFFYRFGKDYMRNWYSLKKNDAVYKMAKAQQDGDFTSALDYKYQIEDLDKKIAGYVQPEDGLANSSANIIASMARNAPELLAVSLGAAAVTYFTGGTGTSAFLSSVGSTALNGAIIYNDTYKLEAGEILQNLEGSDLTLEQKLAAADEYATPAALIEASGALFGLTKMGTSAITKGALSLTEKGAARLQRKGVEKFVKETTKKKLLEELLKRPIAQKIKDPKYLAFFGKKVAEHVLAATGEGAQEVTQEILQDAIINAVNAGEDPNNIQVIDNIFEVLKDGSNSSKYGQLFINTFGASLLISGTGATATTVAQTSTQKLMARSMQNMNADTVSQRIIDQKKNSTAYKKSPKAYSENTAEIVNAGNAPETVAMNPNNLMDVLDEADKKGDTNVLKKLDELGITREKLESSISGTGVLKIDFNQFDNVVLDPNDDSLFQKVKGEYTFDETTLTRKEMEVLMNEMVTKRPELASAIEDKDSAFNIVLTGLMKNKNFTHKQAVYNAALAQLRMNRMTTFRGENGTPVSFDILNRLEKDLGVQGVGLLQKAFHGGPELVGGKFDLKYAGEKTGQTHGYGVYAASEMATAEDYRSRVDSGFTIKGENITDVFDSLLRKNEYEKAGVLEDLMMGKDVDALYEGQEVKKWYDKEIKPFLRSEGKLYTLSIPEEYEMINEQLPFDEQPEDVRFSILGALERINGFGLLEKAIEENAPGGEIYVALGKDVFYDKKGYEGGSTEVQKAASEFLDKIGIKGIVYDGGEEGKNFVIFNPEKASITNKLYMYAGKYSKNPNMDALVEAQLMDANRVPMNEILKKTGWFKDPKDEHWKFEISDKDANLITSAIERVFDNKFKNATLKDVLVHDKLFKAYPWLADIDIRYNPRLKTTLGAYVPSLDLIEIKKTNDFSHLKSIILHEIQHRIQKNESFGRGGSPKGTYPTVPMELWKYESERSGLIRQLISTLKEKKIIEPSSETSRYAVEDARQVLNKLAEKDKEIKTKLDRLDELNKVFEKYDKRSPIGRYLNLPGENEARDTQARANLTEEQRREILPANVAGTRAPVIRFTVGNETIESPAEIGKAYSDQHIAGVFSKEFGKYIIKLTEAANPTTFQHEFTHMTMAEMLDAYNSGEMTEYWQKKTEAIAQFAGFEKDKNGKYIVESSDPTMNAKIVAAHEKVADAFNMYLKEGKAPVESLADIFHQMMEWFVDVYRMLKMSNVKLNKSIRNAFDSLLVSKEEMDQAIIDKNLRAIGRRPGVSESDYQQYLSDLTKLNRISTSKHLEAIRKKQRMATEEKNKQKLDEIRKNVDAQVSQDPKYMLVDDIRARKINYGDIPAGMKLKNPSAFSREDGIPAEQFITDHEDVVSNIADIVELLNNLEDKSQLVERHAQEQFSEWLNEEYPELADVDAKAAATNVELIKVRLKEYMMLMGIPMAQFTQYYNELIKAGNSEIESMKLRELTNIERLLDLETRIVTKARIAKTDKELANALWHQAAVDYVIMRAKDIRTQVKRFNRHFDKYRYLPHASDLKRIDAYDFDMITGILRNLGFTKKRPRVRDITLSSRLTNWINEKMNSSFSDAEEIRDFIPSLSNDIGVKFDNNTYHDFAIFDVLTRLIESISKSDKELTEVNKKELREKDIIETVEYEQKKGINPSSMNWWVDLMVMKEQFLKKILPTRKFLDYVAPFVEGTVLREQRIAKNDELIAEALSNTIKNSKQIFSINLASGGVLNMTYADMQVAVLNIDNMETWIESWNAQKNDELTTDDFMSIIEAAPETMIIDARKIWDVFESQKEEFRHAQYLTNGFLMDYVEPRSITLSDGRTIQSGYYPRGKMPSSQSDFGTMIMSFQNNGVYTMATSKFAKDRKENAKHSELDLTINSLRSWLYHTATVIEIGPKFNKLSKFINNEVMAAQLGKETVKSLNDWMSYSVVGDNLNKFYATLDKISSVQILGWEPIRAAVQAFGWIPSMSSIGPQWIAPQFLKISAYSNLLPFKLETAAKLSPYMRMRYENAVNHISGMSESNQLIRTGKTLADKIMNVAMWFTAHGDAFSSYIVWNAAFDKATAEGYSHDDAVSLADSAVRTSQGDSTGVSRPKILQGDKRVITKFASYFIAMNSRISSAIIGKDRVELVAIMMLAGIVAPVVEAYLRSGYEWFVGSDDDKKKWRKLRLNSFEDVAMYNMKQNVFSTIGQTAMPIAGIGGYVGNLLATGNTYDKPLPMIDYLYSIGKTVSYPALSVTAETEREKQKYLKGFEKSLLKSLTMPNKFIRILTD